MSNKHKVGISFVAHIGRDILQSSELFKNPERSIWEYVANGLQYVEPGVNPEVSVDIDMENRCITIKDNGRGMDKLGLKNFFVMHGENADRREGKTGRGRYGTGKVAAFAIAEVLRIITVKDKRKFEVVVEKSRLSSAPVGNIPIDMVMGGNSTSEANGTTIRYEGVQLPSIEVNRVLRFIERHLIHYPRSCKVTVNGKLCEYHEPAVAQVRKYLPTEQEKAKLGDVELTVKVAKAPLPHDFVGVAVLSSTHWMETTMGGLENKHLANFIFGTIDVPNLDTDTSVPSPFDVSRSMQLNPANALVGALHEFIASRVCELLTELVSEERAQRKEVEHRLLARQASTLAVMFNEDLSALEDGIRLKRGGKPIALQGVVAKPIEQKSPIAIVAAEVQNNKPEAQEMPVQKQEVAKANAAESAKPKQSNGLRIEFRNLGDTSPRAEFNQDEGTIFINLEHPLFTAAKEKLGVEDIEFKRLFYSAAIDEYAIALSCVKIQAQTGEFIKLDEPLFDTRNTIDRMARKIVTLYS